VKLMTGWKMAAGVERNDRWTVAELDQELASLVS
jgi:hypothetical protein